MTNIRDTLIENVRLVTGQGAPAEGWIVLRGGRIQAMGPAGTEPGRGTAAQPHAGGGSIAGGNHADSSAESQITARSADDGLVRIDGEGGYVLPGFIDVHVHGGFGHDFMDADADGLDAIAGFHARHGTTAMLATTVTAPKAALDRVLDCVGRYMRTPMRYAQLLGVHLEGPFISAKWKGAQNGAYIVPPQPDWLETWVRDYPGVLKMQTLAPETDGALDYIERLCRHGVVPACGHTDATYDRIMAAADRGLRHAVHTFNAMRPLHHREPGTVGAVLDDDRISGELIADGHHVHPVGIRVVARQKGTDGVILITDAIAAAGLGEGDYELGGMPVVVAGGKAQLRDSGNLAGSTLTMIDALRFTVRTAGIPLEDASRMASGNPARLLGLDAETGSLDTGKRADVLLLDAELQLRRVWIEGREIDPDQA